MITPLGRWYDRLADRVGQKAAGSLMACAVWLVLAWRLGEL
jgi:hypothetical protein